MFVEMRQQPRTLFQFHISEDAQRKNLIQQKSIRIPSIPTNIKMVETFLLELYEQEGFPEDVLDRVMVSITEVVNNAIVHGNRSDPGKYVTLTCKSSSDTLEFSVRDEGGGFTPDDVPDPLSDQNLMKEGGRGLLIIKSMMDDVRFVRTDEGMEIQLSIRCDMA